MFNINSKMINIKDDISYYKHLHKQITGAYPKPSIIQEFAKLSQDERSGICWDTANFGYFTKSKEDKLEKINTLKQYGKFTEMILASGSL